MRREEKERNTLCVIREQGRQQLSIHGLWYSTLHYLARLSLLFSVSGAKTLSSWSCFEDLFYCVPLSKSWTTHRELRQHTIGWREDDFLFPLSIPPTHHLMLSSSPDLVCSPAVSLTALLLFMHGSNTCKQVHLHGRHKYPPFPF